VSERDARIWLMAAGFGAVFALLNVVNLVFVAGDVVRDVAAAGIGAFVAILGYARSRGWKGARR
jgi:hypothetical protein